MEIKERTIIIKPISRNKFSGHSSYKGTGISFEGAQLSKAGLYKTGLSKEEEVLFCEELGLPKGTLSKNNDVFWGSVLNIRIPQDKVYRFNVFTLMDEIRLRVLLNNDQIAENELKKTSITNFYVDDAQAKANVEEVENNDLMEATDKLRTLTTDEKRGYLKLYGKSGLDSVSESIVNTTLFKEVTKAPSKFIKLFDNPDVKIRIEIEEMIQAKTLKKSGNYYSFQNEVLGTSIESVIAYFKDIRNQSTKIHAVADSKKKNKD